MPVGVGGGCMQSSRAARAGLGGDLQCVPGQRAGGVRLAALHSTCVLRVLWARVHRVLLQTGASEHCRGREPCLKHARLFFGSSRVSRLQPLLQQFARLCCLHWPPCQGLPRAGSVQGQHIWRQVPHRQHRLTLPGAGCSGPKRHKASRCPAWWAGEGGELVAGGWRSSQQRAVRAQEVRVPMPVVHGAGYHIIAAAQGVPSIEPAVWPLQWCHLQSCCRPAGAPLMLSSATASTGHFMKRRQ